MKKISAIVLCFILFLTTFYTNAYASPLTQSLVYEEKSQSVITAGVVYEKSRRIYPFGLVDISVLTIELKNPNVEVDPIGSIKELGLKETVASMAKSNGAVAALNADFFGWGDPQTALGPVIEDGEISQIETNFNLNSLENATLVIKDDGTAFIDYIQNSALTFTNGQASIHLYGKNKVFNALEYPFMYTRHGMTDTTSIDARYANITKIVVEDNVITYISQPGETVDVPENGYIITLYPTETQKYISSFSVGQVATVTETNKSALGNSLDNISTGISAGAFILRNGVLQTSGLIVDPKLRHPRSAVGISQDGSKLILMAVDGRSHSVGATHEELAFYLQQYGAYNAMHFDGGGSTTLVARDSITNEIAVKNTTSDSSPRKVANALGVFSKGKSEEISGFYITIKNSKDNIAFANIPTDVVVSAYDEYHNPTQLPEDAEISLSIEGISATANGKSFITHGMGVGKLTVTVNGISNSIKLYSVASPNAITISPSTATFALGQTRQYTVTARNPEGISLEIPASHIKWETNTQTATIDGNGFFTANEKGHGYVSATINGVTVTSEFYSGEEKRLLTDFSNITEGTTFFSGYPNNATGSVTNIDGAIHLKYGFIESQATQAAYIHLNGEAFKLFESDKKIFLKVNGDLSNNMLRAKIIDASNKEYYVTLAEKIDFTGVREVTATLPEGMAYPARIDRIYIASLGQITATNSTIIIDDLYVLSTGALRNDAASSNMGAFTDYAHRALSQVEGERFDILLSNPLKQQATKNYIWREGYLTTSINQTKIINLTATNGSLRTGDVTQWTKIKNDLYTTTEPYVVVVINKNIQSSSSFINRGEAKMLHDTFKNFVLETGKKLIVAQPSVNDKNSNVINEGVRYVSINQSTPTLLAIKAGANGIYYDFQGVAR